MLLSVLHNLFQHTRTMKTQGLEIINRTLINNFFPRMQLSVSVFKIL